MAPAVGLPQNLDQPTHGERVIDLAIADCVGYPQQALLDDTAGPDCEVADLGIAHLALRQADILAGRLQQAVRAGGPETIEGGSARLPNGVISALLSPAPAVEDHQHDRTTFLHHQHLSGAFWDFNPKLHGDLVGAPAPLDARRC